MPLLAFHKSTDRVTFGVTNFAPERLRGLLELFPTWGYSLADAEDSLGSTQKCGLSFDDGYAHLEPVLRMIVNEFGIRPLVCMPTACIGKTNRWDYSYLLSREWHIDERDIRTLARAGVCFASHGHRHLALTGMIHPELVSELRVSKSILEELTESEVRLVSYPFGRANQEVRAAAKAEGYTAGLTMSFPTLHDEAFSTGRIPIYSFDTNGAIRRKLSTGFGRTLESAKTSVAHSLSRGTIVAQRLAGLLKREIGEA